MRAWYVEHALYAEMMIPKLDVWLPQGIYCPWLPLSIQRAGIVALVVFAAALAGILTRPTGLLASFWPANAVLIGLMVRRPGLAGTAGWIGALLGYLAADAATGGGAVLTIWLTASNLANAAVAVALLLHLDEDDRRLRRPIAIVRLAGIATLAAAASGAVGSGVMVQFFQQGWLRGFLLFFVSELGSNLTILPVLLSLPSLSRLFQRRRDFDGLISLHLQTLLPIVALMVSVVLGTIVGGPGAILIPLPAMIWCALGFTLFPTAFLMLMLGFWQLFILSGRLDPANSGFYSEIVSIRLSLALLALGPMLVSSISTARDETIRQLQRAASHDMLTQALTRSAFMKSAAELLAHRRNEQPPCWAMMIDVDHFKQINDRFGHAAGDAVLAAIGAMLRETLRKTDLLGRLGGEEFAVLLPPLPHERARSVAERLRERCEQLEVQVEPGQAISATVSIGLAAMRDEASPEQPVEPILAELLKAADAAMYEAKRSGRNRVASPAIEP